MKFVIIQPSWDHSEILGSLLYYIKKQNHQVKIIYDWSHPEGNYLDYYCNLFGFSDNIKINYKSPKHHINDCKKAHKIIFVDEIHLKKFLSKKVCQDLIDKIYCFNHLTRLIPYDIKVITLGMVPYKNCINYCKYLSNSYFDPGENMIKINMNIKKKYLIVGNPDHRKLSFLERLPEEILNNIEINFVVRKPFESKFHPNIKILLNISTEELIKMIYECDFIITLFNIGSVYHKDRISGIVPFAISFGKPLIMDREYVSLSEIIGHNKLMYRNSIINFKHSMVESMKMKNQEYQNLVSKIIKFRDMKIIEQYLNFNLMFE